MNFADLHSLPKLPKSRDSPKRGSSTIVLDLVGQRAFNLRALCLAFGGDITRYFTQSPATSRSAQDPGDGHPGDPGLVLGDHHKGVLVKLDVAAILTWR